MNISIVSLDIPVCYIIYMLPNIYMYIFFYLRFDFSAYEFY